MGIQVLLRSFRRDAFYGPRPCLCRRWRWKPDRVQCQVGKRALAYADRRAHRTFSAFLRHRWQAAYRDPFGRRSVRVRLAGERNRAGGLAESLRVRGEILFWLRLRCSVHLRVLRVSYTINLEFLARLERFSS